jgi:hypothetical protein
MKKKILIYIYLILNIAGTAQEKLGISNSNYLSTGSIFLNPSASVDSRAYIQINLVGANAYFMNNLGYLPKFSLRSALRSNSVEDFKISSLKLKKFLYAVACVDGPAFIISKRNYGGGFFTRARSVAEFKGVPFEVTNFLLNPDASGFLSFPLNVDLKNIRFSSMTWVEYGLNFGMMIKKESTNLLSLGGNIKYLTGVNIAYGYLKQFKTVIDRDRAAVDNLEGKLRFNEPGWNTGRGLGVDIGFTYKKMLEVIDRYYANSKKSNCKYVDYQYKFALALRDLGAINFKTKTSTSNIKASGQFNVDTNNRNVDFQKDLENNFNIVIENKPIRAALPTSLSMQLDYNFGYHFYLNTTVIKNLIPNSITGVQGANLISFCPRYELKNIELSMPLTFQKFLYPQLGAALRVRTFVLGFDNVFPLVIKKNTYGLNVYVSFGISIFSNQSCRKHIRRIDDCASHNKSKKKTNKKKRPSKPTKRNSFLKDDRN